MSSKDTENLEKNSRLRRSRTTFRSKDRNTYLRRHNSDTDKLLTSKLETVDFSIERARNRSEPHVLECDTESEKNHVPPSPHRQASTPGSSSSSAASSPMGTRYFAPRTKLQWCELPQVRESGLLDQMTDKEKQLQEAMYELVSSERSHLEVIRVLMHHFADCPEFAAILTRQEREQLFPDLSGLISASEMLLADLEERMNESLVLSRVCDVLLRHAEGDGFVSYVRYCCNLSYQERTLAALKEHNPEFVRTLQNLENAPLCKNNSLHSHIVSPMQRITKYPLLVSAIVERLKPETEDYEVASKALKVVKEIATKCNETKRKMEEREQMLTVVNKLQFRDVPTMALVSDSRRLIKEGATTEILDPNNKQSGRHSRHLFLFNDMLLVATRKSAEMFRVNDYCREENLAIHQWASIYKNFENPEESHLLLDIFRNHKGEPKSFVLAFKNSQERKEWSQAINSILNSSSRKS